MIFVDTSFWVAVRNRRDHHHDAARRLLEAHESSRLITSNHVRGETWTYLRRKAGHAAAIEFLDTVARSPRVEVAWVSPEVEEGAVSWLGRHDEREYSFVDATSFALMRELAIERAFAFDGDFGAAGFVELRPEA